MTVDIFAICEKGESGVGATDKLRSFGQFFEIEMSSPKSEIFNPNCIIFEAGSGDDAYEMVHAGMKNFADEAKIETIARGMQSVYKSFRAGRVEDNVLSKFGLNWESYLKGQANLNSQVALDLHGMLKEYQFQTGLLVAGIDKEGCHLYAISDPGAKICFDKNGYWAIGSGQPFALVSLAVNGYNKERTLKEALFDVFEAKKTAEIACGVGVETDLFTVTKDDGVRKVDDAALEELNNIYALKRKDENELRRNLADKIMTMKL